MYNFQNEIIIDITNLIIHTYNLYRTYKETEPSCFDLY